MDNWETLHTVHHNFQVYGVDLSLDYMVQARPLESGEVALRICTQNLSDSRTTTLLKLPESVLSQKVSGAPMFGMDGVFESAAKYPFATRTLALPIKPPQYWIDLHVVGARPLTMVARDSAGWVETSCSFKGYYAFAIGTHRVVSELPRGNGYCMNILRYPHEVSVSVADLPQAVAANLEFISDSIAWREYALDELDAWLKPYLKAHEIGLSNKSSAAEAISGLKSMMVALRSK